MKTLVKNCLGGSWGVKYLVKDAWLRPRVDQPLAGSSRAMKMFYVYFAKSLSSGKVYTGFTSKEPILRVKEHNSGSNQWSKANRPLELIYFESYVCKKDAMMREKFYKSGVGKKVKLAIVRELVKDD